MTPQPARLYTIDPGIPFADALAAGMLARLGGAGDPLALARATVLLPTRRSVRSLREAFLRASDGAALLLPRMMPLGDIDEDELIVSEEASADLPVQPVIGGLRRQLMLAHLVMRFGGARWQSADPAQAAELAAELARLFDSMETERIPPDRLREISPEDENLAAHWGDVLEFLRILTEHWPAVLAEEGAVGPAARRDALLAARARAWAATPPGGWVVAAGSTGSIPATANLLSVVARLPRGCVVLPGLDRAMDESAWHNLRETHPQFGMARLLDHLDAARADVADWAADWAADWSSRAANPAAGPRAQLIAAALADDPADPGDAARATENLEWIECPAPGDEASAIALVMREVLNRDGETAALVTPDRDLARRVASRLQRWDIAVDDSAGRPLASMPVAAFLRLVAECAGGRMAAVALLSCLKHPLAQAGMPRADHLARVRDLDALVLRGPATGPGLDAIVQRLRRNAEAAVRLQQHEAAARIAALEPWLETVGRCLAPLARLLDAGGHDVATLARAHVAAAEALAAGPDRDGADRLWRGDDAEALAAFIADLTASAGGFPPMRARDYPALFDALLAGRVVRPRYGRHPRLHIWGPLEARLQHADAMILGSLNEGTWPPDAGADPWMSRPMRRRLGLPLPERRIGLAAHDFAQAFCARRVVLTRAHRVGGTPTVPSRWLTRLANVLGEKATLAAKEKGAGWLARVDAAARHRAAVTLRRPMPVPAAGLRPRRLSVTEVETLQINPYAIYARHVLGLRPLDDIAADPGAAERGTFIHSVMETFFARFPKGVPEGGSETFYAALGEIAQDALGPAGIAPGLRAVWWPRFLDIARWVAAEEAQRRAVLRPLAAETKGRLRIEVPGGDFLLIGKADRVDAWPDGRLEIVDYKTGAPPSPGDQKAGFAPQLPLLGAMAEAGAFDGVRPAAVAGLSYWHLKGGTEGGEARMFAREKGVEVPDAIKGALAGLIALIKLFDDPAQPYAAYPVPGRMPRFDDYEHLARVQEWAADAAGEGEDA